MRKLDFHICPEKICFCVYAKKAKAQMQISYGTAQAAQHISLASISEHS